MFATCTVNPSLDLYMEFEHALHAGTNRSHIEYYEAGGKGINVSIVLSNLGIPSNAFGFIGGFTKDQYVTQLAKYKEIRPNFTYINGNTRINVKCGRAADSDLNAYGPIVAPEEVDNMFRKVENVVEGDFFAFSGNVQEHIEERMVEMLAGRIQEKVRVLLDTNVKIMKDLLPYHPFMVKVDPAQLEQIIGRDLITPEDLISGVKQLHEIGAERAVLMCDRKTVFMCCDEGTYHVDIQDDSPTYHVGVGDALVAGFMMDYMRSRNNVEALRYGACCGKATTLTNDLPGLKAEINKMYEKTEADKID